MGKNKEVKSIVLCSNGNLIVFDEKGKQIPKFQGNVIVDLFKKVKRNNYEIEGVEIDLPDGSKARKLKGVDNIKII